MSISDSNSIALDLTSAPSVLFLFGLAGVGKSYLGDMLANLSGRSVYHADVDITKEMRAALARGESFTEAMRDDYFSIVATRITEHRAKLGPLIVTQAAYKERHREYLRGIVGDIEFIHVVASDQTTIHRLNHRGNLVTQDLANLMRTHFEPPPPGTKTIENEGELTGLIARLRELGEALTQR
jgi:gluconokinase